MVTLPMRGRARALAVSLGLGLGLAILAFLGFLASCYAPPTDLPAAPLLATPSGTDPARGPDALGDDGAASSVAGDGLPCDVARVLAASCTDCHGRPLTSGAPMPLLTYEDLAAKSKSDPARSVAALSVERITDARRPMPPDEALEAPDVAVLAGWVAAGTPRSACHADPPDASPVEDAGADVAAPPVAVSGSDGGSCTSGTSWTAGTPASELMHPGRACIACHAASGGPSTAVAGTVYTALHEPDDCNGTSAGPLDVLIIDATGQPHTLPVNSAGNFLRVTRIPVPYRAMVVRGTDVREMRSPQTDGDCNGCHSAGGNQAPGRILAP